MAIGDLVLPPGYGHAAVRIKQSTVGHECVCTFGIRLAGSTLTLTQASSLLAGIANALKPLHDNTVTYPTMHVLIGNDGPPLAVDAVSTITGSGSFTAYAPPQVSHLIKRTTGFAGKRYRGRLFVPFVDEAAVDNAGTLAGGHLAKLLTAAVALDAVPGSTPDTGVEDWVLLHRVPTTGSAPAPTTILGHTPSSKVATQRRRLER